MNEVCQTRMLLLVSARLKIIYLTDERVKRLFQLVEVGLHGRLDPQQHHLIQILAV